MSEKSKKISPVFENQAISDEARKAGNSNVNIPPEASIKEAKKWVDQNEK